jgi:O-antigen/teichoic acid export membrane protein
LNRPKDAFNITLIAAILNIVLDIAFIPVMGIAGAALATLIAMSVNALGALILLSRVISVKFEFKPIKNIFFASGIMGITVVCMYVLLPLSHVIAILTVVTIGALIYILVLFKLDRKIHDEIRDLSVNLGIPWPQLYKYE